MNVRELERLVTLRRAAVAAASDRLRAEESSLADAQARIRVADSEMASEHAELAALQPACTRGSLGDRLAAREAVAGAERAIEAIEEHRGRLEERLGAVLEEVEHRRAELAAAIADFKAVEGRLERALKAQRAKRERREEDDAEDATLRRWRSTQ